MSVENHCDAKHVVDHRTGENTIIYQLSNRVLAIKISALMPQEALLFQRHLERKKTMTSDTRPDLEISLSGFRFSNVAVHVDGIFEVALNSLDVTVSNARQK